MRRYVFGILSYNQEKYIVETLESIKFQKVQYGADIEVSLIITDDASKDNTVAVLNDWIAKNRDYFVNVDVIANEKNQGIVPNFCKIVQMVDAEKEYLKIIAGDDLIGYKNVFAEYETLNDKKLKTYFRVELCEGKISYREKYLIEFYYHMTHGSGRDYNLKYFKRGRYLHTPSTLYTKNLFLNANVEKNLEGYRLYEDDPMWYSMIKNEKDLEIEFVPQGMVLYRMHNQSVSNAPNPMFQRDKKRLREKYLAETKGFEKLYLLIRMYSSKLPMYLNLSLYIDKLVNMSRKQACKKDPGYQLFKENIEKQIVQEQKFYDSITENITKESVSIE